MIATAGRLVEPQKGPAGHGCGSIGLRAQFDKTISPIFDLQTSVKQKCCAILCDVVRIYAAIA